METFHCLIFISHLPGSHPLPSQHQQFSDPAKLHWFSYLSTMLPHPAQILWFNIIITPFHTNSTPLYLFPLLDLPSKILTLVETSFHPLDTYTHLTRLEETAPPGSLVLLLIHDCWFQWATSAANNPAAWPSRTLSPTPKRTTTQQLSSKPCLTPPPHRHGWSCFPLLQGAKKSNKRELSFASVTASTALVPAESTLILWIKCDNSSTR